MEYPALYLIGIFTKMIFKSQNTNPFYLKHVNHRLPFIVYILPSTATKDLKKQSWVGIRLEL